MLIRGRYLIIVIMFPVGTHGRASLRNHFWQTGYKEGTAHGFRLTYSDKNGRKPLNAIVGEAMAYLKYNAYAHKALEEGYPEMAQVFQEVARAETIHGMNHLRVAGEIGPTAKNLRNVTVGETKEFSFMYPRMIRDAQDEGRQDAVDSFAWRWKGKDITWMFLPKRCSGWRRVRRRHRSLSHPPRHPP